VRMMIFNMSCALEIPETNVGRLITHIFHAFVPSMSSLFVMFLSETGCILPYLV